MTKAVQRVGDQNSAGGLVINGDSTVLINGRPVAIQGSLVTPHPCCGKRGCPPVHCSARTTSNTPTVLVNGKPIITLGALDTCNHTRVGGSPDVVVGG